MADQKNIRCVSFNCLGYKNSRSFIDSLCLNNDICFLCEHWLKPCELTAIKSELKQQHLWSVMKSSMDPEKIQAGRTHGGVGFICKEILGMEYRSIDIVSDRLCAIQLLCNHSVILTVIGVYMPYFNGSNDQVNMYMQVLEILQGLIDVYSEGKPCVIIGDFNASLPQQLALQTNWYKTRPFNRNSLLLFDFIVNNDLIVSNFCFSQPANFTYFKGHNKTYIDHCITTGYTQDLVQYCHILYDNSDNVSDHLPLCLSINIPYCKKNVSLSSSNSLHKFINWKDSRICDAYQHNVCLMSKDIAIPGDTYSLNTPEQVQAFVDTYCENITNVLHKAADSAVLSIDKSKCTKKVLRKPWWSDDCRIARDRNRFWFSVWRSCGRPSDILLHLCNLLSYCFKLCAVPYSFTDGILVPILKKSSLDPSLPKNYRPIIVSTILSKYEMYILEECNGFSYSDYQFGFVHGRGTNTAISLAHDVIAYCNHNNSPVFACSLDAEGAFDGIPHPIIFMKLIDVMPDVCWKFMYYWYSKIHVKIKWNVVGNPIKICKGTCQGGLTSSFIFNVFYKQLIYDLSTHEGGISIGSQKFNVYCYADDILLMSTTVSGLQGLIDTSVKYISKHGLKFNHNKTNCMISGGNPFVVKPKLYIEKNILSIANNIDYLGATLGDNSGNCHVKNRISACRKAFYALQSIGLNNPALNIDVGCYLWSVICKSTISYACEAIYLKKSHLRELNKVQAKLIKCMVGIGEKYRTTPLLQALYLNNMSNVIEYNTVVLYQNIMKSNSAARKFYITMSYKKKNNCTYLLNNRVKSIFEKYDLKTMKSLLFNRSSTSYKCNSAKHVILHKVTHNSNGLVDTIRTLLKSRTHHNLMLLRLLLQSF